MNKTAILLSAAPLLAAAGVFAGNPLQGEVEIRPVTKLERNAGLWLDGQYIGSVDALDGRGRLTLVPGEHHLLFRLIGHDDIAATINVGPGSQLLYRLAMLPTASASYPEEVDTARLRIDVEPELAAVFINDSFVGEADRFGTRQGMRLSAGTYRVTIAQPGYEPFNAELTLRAGQTYEVKTELRRGHSGDQARELTTQVPAPAER